MDYKIKRTHFVKKICTIICILITIFVCVWPMSKLPIYNGQEPGHRNQYELMAESILHGKISITYGDEKELEKLDNPYDPEEREAKNITYHWDHAYYNGHYYMYFGVVPVFLVFLPYRIITGTALTTYHATQIFTAAIIIGLFLLLRMLQKLFFKKMPFVVYLATSIAFSVICVWYATAAPALYCTAITAGVALEVWSLYFYIRAVYKEEKENKQILLAGIGAIFGALAFGCRPPLALANVVVIPLLIKFIKDHKLTWKLVGKIILVIIPYVVVIGALMVYNYARFANPFEFGQAYQLTVADQRQYSSMTIDASVLRHVLSQTFYNLFGFKKPTGEFPYVLASSVFFNFPIFFLSFAIVLPPVFQRAKKTDAQYLLIGLIPALFIISAIEVLWSPIIGERYRMDLYFLMVIGCFIILGFWLDISKHRKIVSTIIILLAIVAVITAFLLYVGEVGRYYPDKVLAIARALRLECTGCSDQRADIKASKTI